MRMLAALALLTLLAPSAAQAYIAREPIVRVVRQAYPDIRACIDQHDIEEGRYVIRFEIDGSGRVGSAAVTSGPVEPSPAARSCIEAAFLRLRFPSYERGSRELPVRTGAGRRSRVPPDPLRSRVGRIVIIYPILIQR